MNIRGLKLQDYNPRSFLSPQAVSSRHFGKYKPSSLRSRRDLLANRGNSFQRNGLDIKKFPSAQQSDNSTTYVSY